MVKRIRRKKVNKSTWHNRGTTLVEMIVCFALLLMVSATQIMHSAMRTYSKVKRSSAGQDVADLLCDKVEAELSSASARQVPDVSDNNEVIFYYDRQNRPVRIMLSENGYLHFAYGKEEEESYWEYDPQVYRGYKITELKFYKVMPSNVENRTYENDKDDLEWLDNSQYADNIYKVQITLRKSNEGDYIIERYIRCRALEPE